MNAHQSACFFLLFVTGGMLYGVNSLRNQTSAAREQAQLAETQAEEAGRQAQLADIQLKTLDSKTSELRTVYKEWQPHFEHFRTPQDAEQRVAEIIREGDVFLISQKFESSEIDNASAISEALVGDLVVEDDYTKAVNWLGRLEEAIPTSRITRCEIARGDRGNDVHLVVRIQIPILKS